MSSLGSTVCVLVSGGLDSAVLLHRLLRQGKRVVPLYVRCGLRWEGAELQGLRRFLRAVQSPRLLPLEILDLPMASVYGDHWSLRGQRVPGAKSDDHAVYLPGRNVLLLSAAAIVCAKRNISTIALGILRGNPFGDATPRFFKPLASCLSQALGRPVRLVTPLRRLSKARLIREARLPLAFTCSCLRPVGRLHCGRCNKCAERKRAFQQAGVADLTSYAG